MKRLILIPALHRATHRVGLHLQAQVPEVTQAEAHLLAHLHESSGESTVAELHRAWAHKRSTLTDIIDRLERQRLARRSVLPQDRRSVLVRLTTKGKRVAASVHDELLALEHEILAQIGSAKVDLGDLAAGLETVDLATVSISPGRNRRKKP